MIDTSAVIDGVLPDLHADSRSDLAFWTFADLVGYEDEALKRLARLMGIFVNRTVIATTTPAQASYTLPLQHVATLHVSYDTTPLRPGNMSELESRDPDFRTVLGTPDHWYEDLVGSPAIAVTPVPEFSTSLAAVYTAWPPDLDAAESNHTLAAPAPLKSYLAMAVIAAAYSEEGESEMPDIAQHCKGRMAMVEQALAGYYGRGI